jgi:filamentous hemagglutinin family protein
MTQRLYTPPIFPPSPRPFFLLPSFFFLLSAFFPLSASAQITPDGTVGTVVTGGPAFTINGGSRPSNGPNLFHSFSQFSVPTGGSAIFNNAADVTNIISRVTGGSISSIDGLIQANGSANLFLINPAGIIFGPNASLNIGGSFIGSTAQSLKFSDGTEFSATNPAASPLLTINVPIGLQIGSNSGDITVQGAGNQLVDLTGFGQASTINSPPGLQAGVQQTLALIGGSVNFSGGVASINDSGHLELGSVRSGTVGLTATPTGWVGDYRAVTQFKDIRLAQDSMLNASGSQGSIQVQGQNISLTEGSAILLQNLGTQSSGGITIHANGSLILTGNTINGELGSLIQSNNLGNSQIGDIAISAANLSLQEGGRVVSRTRSQTSGANIITDVSGTVEINGFNANNPAVYSGIVTFSVSKGSAGNITVSTENLRILDSGTVISVAVRSGETGTIQVNAAEKVEILGYNPLAFGESTLSTFTQGAGNANRVLINTGQLVLQGGASLGSSTQASGSAGSVEVNASNFIEIQGRVTEGSERGLPARIFSNAEISDPSVQSAFQLPQIPTGNSGSLAIHTPSLRLVDGGAVSVKNDGRGIAGDVQIHADTLLLDYQGSITAVAESGEGGNIVVQADALILRHNSLISATAGGTGNGGNITLRVPVIAGFENSDIVANAFQGNGGKITITTKGIFGLKFRPQLTPENDITASSQFGLNGTVAINNVTVDPAAGLVQLPVVLADASRKMGSVCDSTQGSSFVYTGRGGLPENPLGRLESLHPWEDLRDLSAFQNQASVPPPSRQKLQPTMIVEANAIRRNLDGTVELVATGTEPVPMDSAVTCAGRLWMGELNQ